MRSRAGGAGWFVPDLDVHELRRAHYNHTWIPAQTASDLGVLAGDRLGETPMAIRKFLLVARVSTENTRAVKRGLLELMPAGSVTRTEAGFLVKAELRGARARAEPEHALRPAAGGTQDKTARRATSGATYHGASFRLRAEGEATRLTTSARYSRSERQGHGKNRRDRRGSPTGCPQTH